MILILKAHDFQSFGSLVTELPYIPAWSQMIFIRSVMSLKATDFFVNSGENDEKGRTPTQRFEAFYAEYERQLENPKTGEELIFVPLAVVSFTMGTLIIIKRKRSYI